MNKNSHKAAIKTVNIILSIKPLTLYKNYLMTTL